MNLGDKDYLVPESDFDVHNPSLGAGNSQIQDKNNIKAAVENVIKSDSNSAKTAQSGSKITMKYKNKITEELPEKTQPNDSKQQQATPKQPGSFQPPLSLLYSIILTLVFVITFSLAIVFLVQKNNQQVAGATDIPNIEAQVKKLIAVPDNESPQVSLVADPNQVKSYNPNFFKDVQKGDYFLLYSNEAVLYRSSSNQVIAAAKLNITN